MTDIRTILRETTQDLAAHGSPSARLDAEVLLKQFLKTDRIQLLAHPERTLSEEEIAVFAQWVQRRRRGEPVSYIVGEKEFWSLPFAVNREVLIPRPETECLIEEVLACVGQEPGAFRILDIGTGSGAIGVTLAKELPAARVVATDISAGALEVARRNALRHRVAERMEFLLGDLLTPVSGIFDLIVSNPPYIADEKYPLLPEGIRAFEPRQALIAGSGGTAFHRAIIREGANHLRAGGSIFLEIGEGQKELVETLFRETGMYDAIRFRKDYGGVDRVVGARKTHPTLLT
jgi:release factor glutamine methyltransferase